MGDIYLKKKLGILDEVAYSYRLMQRFNKVAKSSYTVYSFSEKNSVEKFLENESMDVLLVGEKFLEDITDLNLNCQIIILSESEKLQEEKSIFKYQASGIILHQLNDFLRITTKGKNEESKVKIYAVYSPVRRCGKSKTALALANKFATKSRVLLLSLEPFSMIESENEGAMTLSDVFYYLEQDKTDEDIFSKAIINYNNRIKTILPMESPVDMQEIDDEKWNQFFVKMTSIEETDVIVIDFDESVSCFLHLFELCDKVFMPVLEEENSLNKFRKFEDFLQKSMSDDIQKKICKLNIPIIENKDNSAIDKFIARLLQELKADG